MPWSISMSVSGWERVREQLNQWEDADLIKAISDDRYEMVYPLAGPVHANAALCAAHSRLGRLSHDELVDAAYRLIEEHQTCEVGGHGVWIDREGFHIVWLDSDTRSKSHESQSHRGADHE